MALEEQALMPPPKERSPLLISKKSSGPDPSDDSLVVNVGGMAGITETVINLSKTCAGTGCLALPFACAQGGLVLYCVGIPLVALWNVVAIDRLVRCSKFLPRTPTVEEGNVDEDQKRHPPETSTLGKLAWIAFGEWGLESLDTVMLILLFGVNISYVSAVVSFLSVTSISVTPFWDATCFSSIIAALSMVPDMGYLARASALGLFVLAGTLLVITLYGFSQRGEPHVGESSNPLNLWPSSVTSFFRFFGVAFFGYGSVPLTFNFQESMREPHRMVEAASIAHFIVAIVYIVVGVGLLALFHNNVTGEILHQLPHHGLWPTGTRLAMVAVVVLTAPLLILPTSDLIQQKYQISNQHAWIVKLATCYASALVAVLFPSFVQVLSVVGCACVAMVGFVVPTLLHLRLLYLHYKGSAVWPSDIIALLGLDTVLLLLGIIASVVGTIYNLG